MTTKRANELFVRKVYEALLDATAVKAHRARSFPVDAPRTYQCLGDCEACRWEASEEFRRLCIARDMLRGPAGEWFRGLRDPRVAGRAVRLARRLAPMFELAPETS